ncbi:MAG: hypothetical protein ACRDF4_04160 [Rhabdochlamydiaceae bacterium]
MDLANLSKNAVFTFSLKHIFHIQGPVGAIISPTGQTDLTGFFLKEASDPPDYEESFEGFSIIELRLYLRRPELRQLFSHHGFLILALQEAWDAANSKTELMKNFEDIAREFGLNPHILHRYYEAGWKWSNGE